jgi:hypothetical protein
VKAIRYEGINVELILTVSRFTLRLDYTRGENEHTRIIFEMTLMFTESERTGTCNYVYIITNIVRSESRCALRLRYVDLVVSIEIALIHCLMS